MDFEISSLNLNFAMIYVNHKILLLIKNNLNYLQDNIFECFFQKYLRRFLHFQEAFCKLLNHVFS